MPLLASLASLLSSLLWVNFVLFKAHGQWLQPQWNVFRALSHHFVLLIWSFCSLSQILLFSYSSKFILYRSPLKSKSKQDLDNLFFYIWILFLRLFFPLSRWDLLRTRCILKAQVGMYPIKQSPVVPSDFLGWKNRRDRHIYVYMFSVRSTEEKFS